MTNSGKLFADELPEWLLEACFIQYQWQMSIYYKYAPDGSKTVILFYVDDCVYWYTNEALGKWFVDTLGKRFHVNILGICTLVNVNKNFSDEVSIHLYGSG